MVKIIVFTSAIPALSPHNLLSPRNSLLIILFASFFSALTIQSSSIPSLFTMYKLCKIMHSATICGIFLKRYFQSLYY